MAHRKYANKEKSGSESVKNYDPKNRGNFSGSKGTKASKMHKFPKNADTPSAPGRKKNRGRSNN